MDLYPDYYIPKDALEEVSQDVIPGDVIFTKDGKIACAGMITESDRVILSSGIERIRLNEEGKSGRKRISLKYFPHIFRPPLYPGSHNIAKKLYFYRYKR